MSRSTQISTLPNGKVLLRLKTDLQQDGVCTIWDGNNMVGQAEKALFNNIGTLEWVRDPGLVDLKVICEKYPDSPQYWTLVCARGTCEGLIPHVGMGVSSQVVPLDNDLLNIPEINEELNRIRSESKSNFTSACLVDKLNEMLLSGKDCINGNIAGSCQFGERMIIEGGSPYALWQERKTSAIYPTLYNKPYQTVPATTNVISHRILFNIKSGVFTKDRDKPRASKLYVRIGYFGSERPLPEDEFIIKMKDNETIAQTLALLLVCSTSNDK